MTPLRQRFVEDLRLRGYSPRTLQAYVSGVARFALHFRQSPDLLGAEHVRLFQLHMLEQRIGWSTFNQTVSALKLFYKITLGRPEALAKVPFGKRPKTLPEVLSPQEVLVLFQTAQPGRDRVLLQTAYACGLRVGEVVALQVGDIDSRRRVVAVRQGKGKKDRLVPLSAKLLALLRDYWRHARPVKPWLFPGRIPGRPISIGAVQRMCHTAVLESGLLKKASMHTLRHSYATHQLEAGIDLVTLQQILGHEDLNTTTIYLHLSTRHFQQVPSLLELLAKPANDMGMSTKGARS